MKNEVTKQIRVYGIVQGVGFRPTVSRHAATHQIRGSVSNKGPYVEIFAQGPEEAVDGFISDIENKPPKRAAILKMNIEQVEEAWVIYVNQAAKVIRKQRISIGGIASTQVDVRVIMKEALLCGATSFFLVHNHPSGNLTPSRDDDRLTGALVEAGRMMNIKVLDHLIIGNNEYFSYADEGRL